MSPTTPPGDSDTPAPYVPPPPRPVVADPIDRWPTRRRATWAAIVSLLGVIFLLTSQPWERPRVGTEPPTPGAADVAAAAQQGQSGEIPIAPGTADPPSYGQNGGPTTAQLAGLDRAAMSLGSGTDHHEIRVYAGYTVSAGAVEPAAQAVYDRMTRDGGRLLANVTDNQGSPTVVHAEVTFLIPQTDVDQFLTMFTGDYQVYGKEISSLDRSGQYENAVTNQILDNAQIDALTAQAKEEKDIPRRAGLNAKIQLLHDRVKVRGAAIDESVHGGSLSRLTILLDERRPVSQGSINAAWRLGSSNVIGIATALIFIGLTASPALFILVPLWLMRHRIAPKLGIVRRA